MSIKKQIFTEKKFAYFVLLFLCGLSVNATSLFCKGGNGKIVSTTTNALDALSTMKENYKEKNKSGTLILIYNKTLEELAITDSGNSKGKFYTYPINIPPKRTLVFFHVGIDNIIPESIGKIVLQEKESKAKHATWWSTSYFGKNTCSPNGEIIQDGSFPLLHFVIEPYNAVDN